MHSPYQHHRPLLWAEVTSPKHSGRERPPRKQSVNIRINNRLLTYVLMDPRNTELIKTNIWLLIKLQMTVNYHNVVSGEPQESLQSSGRASPILLKVYNHRIPCVRPNEGSLSWRRSTVCSTRERARVTVGHSSGQARIQWGEWACYEDSWSIQHISSYLKPPPSVY